MYSLAYQTVIPLKVIKVILASSFKSLLILLIYLFIYRLGLDTQSTISFENFVNHFQDNEVRVSISSIKYFSFQLTFSYIWFAVNWFKDSLECA